MINSKENFYKIQQLLITLIACTIFFRAFCTILIIVFAIYSACHYKYLQWPKNGLKYGLWLSLPMVLEIIFFWNNSTLTVGLKSMEKSISFIIFPLFILGSYKKISFYLIANYYRHIASLILILLLIRFAIISPELVNKYLNGVHLWEMGYVFTNSFNNHAPAVNMHVAFLTIINSYFFIKEFKKRSIINFSLLATNVFSLFIINTRIALATTIICILILILDLSYRKVKTKFLFIKKICITLFVISSIVIIAFKTNPFMKEKYSNVTFAHMDKIGKLDEIDNPESTVFNAFVTRLSIWKSSYELGLKQPLYGYGSGDAKKELVTYFKDTNQKFLAKYEFPVHNQILDYFIKYGILGALLVIIYLFSSIVIGFKSKNILLVCFGINFLISNLFDDYLIRFDGIVFYAIWFSLGMSSYLKNKELSVIDFR